jgi:DNA-binding CsgD family transcriptional regulator
VRRTLLYGTLGGLLLALLALLEYQVFVRTYPGELYAGIVAVLFTVLGLWLGRRSLRPREVVRVREVPVPAEPFAVDQAALRQLGITPREHEILGLIADGLSNREIAQRLFVSENTVKTHASRLFDKLGARRRVQAVQRGREEGLVP